MEVNEVLAILWGFLVGVAFVLVLEYCMGVI